MELFLKGRFEEGDITILNKERVRSLFMSKEGQHCEITIRPYKRMMSAAQMRWYRGIAINIIINGLKEADGKIWDKDDIHAYNIAKIMKPKIKTIEVLGETIVETSKFSMADMTKEEFEWFKTELQAFWAERGIDIPDPNEENFLNDYDGTGIRSIGNFKKENP
jgi:hypothetical protein